jgi:vacuolar-type H+-ATPase subunit B/Vma2
VMTEDLWDIPLLSKDGFNLNSIAKHVNAVAKAAGEENFVPTTVQPTAEDKRNTLRLEVIKYVIGIKVEEQDLAKKKAEKAAQRDKLVELLGRKQDAALEQLTPEQIREELAKLGD